MKRFLPILLFVAGIGLWGLLRPEPPTAEIRPPSGPHVDKALATLLGIRWPDLSGKPRGLEVAADRVRVINFWATWCVPCSQEHPLLLEAAQRYQDRGVVFLGVLYGDTADKAVPFLKKHGSAYPNLLDPGQVTAIDYGVGGVPETFFIDKSGMIARKVVGPVSPDEMISTLESLL